MSSPYPTYPTTQMLYFIVDNSVLSPSGKPTLKGLKSGCECNAPWIPLQPGDRLIFKSYIKTGPSTVPRTLYGDGARIGIDFYSGQGRIGQWCAEGQPQWDETGGQKPFSATQAWMVPFNSDWTLRVMDFICPDVVISDGISIAGYSQGQEVTPVGFIPWLAQMSLNWADDAECWFGDVSMEVIPKNSPVVTPPSNQSLAARVPMVGNGMLVQFYLRKLRDRVFSKEMHKRLHPLI
jgi:hypothetical protein